MRYPTMGKNPRNAVSVPALSGGVNRADALNLVDDNQLTDCKNVWYKDGMLQTRPGIEEIKSEALNFEDYSSVKGDFIKNEVYVDGVAYKLHVANNNNKITVRFFSAEKRSGSFCAMSVVVDFNDKSFLKTLLDKKTEVTDEKVTFKNCTFYNSRVTLENGKGLYMLATFEGDLVFLFELVGNSFTFVEPGFLYTPTVYINGKGADYSSLPSDIQTQYAAASSFEGYSAISNAWADYYFVTDGKSSSFAMPKALDNYRIKFEYTDPQTGRKYTSGTFDVTENDLSGSNLRKFADGFEGYVQGQDELYVDKSVFVSIDNDISSSTVERKKFSFYIMNPDYSEGATSVPKYLYFCFKSSLGVIANNLKIKVRVMPSRFADGSAPQSNLAGMTISNSFGGGAEGIYGGSRIFLAGASEEKENMLAWSDTDNPTYFSENNYVHVGNGGQKITAIEKQDNMLVIYKENEMFYTVYSAGSSYTAEDVIAGRVLDVSTLDATFPITQISDHIGCNVPNSVKLCGDRLVWAYKEGIYMLRSANQYSNVNISKISNMLGEFKLAKDSTATAYMGFYMLSSKNIIYLLNFDQYYFNALPSYSDSKKANRKMQWFIWEVPKPEYSRLDFVSDAENLLLISMPSFENLGAKAVAEEEASAFSTTGIGERVWLFSGEDDIYNAVVGDESTVKKQKIESVIQTKMFDFGAMERFKAIEQTYIEFGKSQGEVEVQYLTERGRLDELSVDLTDTAEEHSPEFIKTKRLLPGIKRALRFGMRLTAKGQVKLGGILIKFKYMGATR